MKVTRGELKKLIEEEIEQGLEEGWLDNSASWERGKQVFDKMAGTKLSKKSKRAERERRWREDEAEQIEREKRAEAERRRKYGARDDRTMAALRGSDKAIGDHWDPKLGDPPDRNDGESDEEYAARLKRAAWAAKSRLQEIIAQELAKVLQGK